VHVGGARGNAHTLRRDAAIGDVYFAAILGTDGVALEFKLRLSMRRKRAPLTMMGSSRRSTARPLATESFGAKPRARAPAAPSVRADLMLYRGRRK